MLLLSVFGMSLFYGDPVRKWHRTLGHLAFQNMLNLLGSSTETEISAKQIQGRLKPCAPCVQLHEH
jgi:hypothetical protein